MIDRLLALIDDAAEAFINAIFERLEAAWVEAEE